jgi:hypothetical protein
MYTKLLATRLGLIRGDRKNKIPAIKPKSFSQGETHERTSPTRQPEIQLVFISRQVPKWNVFSFGSDYAATSAYSRSLSSEVRVFLFVNPYALKKLYKLSGCWLHLIYPQLERIQLLSMLYLEGV